MVWVLTGFMGCGKTSIGRLVASMAAEVRFIDLDEEIERREGRSIPEIFSTEGENYFRCIERNTLSELLLVPQGERTQPAGMLLSLGGGTLMDAESRELVRENCKCIYLRASLETLAENLQEAGTEGRPMLKLAPGESLEGRIRNLMAGRKDVYESCADLIIDIDSLDYPTIAQQILNAFRQ